MSTDPRSLNYPSHDDRDATPNDVPSPAEEASREKVDRRTGTNDELKELDRAERRKS
jgi:hypothetical protein